MSHREEQHRKKRGAAALENLGQMDGQTQSTDTALIAQEENELHNTYFHQKNS